VINSANTSHPVGTKRVYGRDGSNRGIPGGNAPALPRLAGWINIAEAIDP
jgi:hypothetical protein